MNHAETVTAPAFSPYGKTTVDGGTVYRFPASSMRADLPEQAVSVLGQQPEIETATLPVSPGPDRSVRRTLHLRQRVGAGPARAELSRHGAGEWVGLEAGVGGVLTSMLAALSGCAVVERLQAN